VLALVLCACARGKLGKIEVPLSGAVNRQYIIYIETVSASSARFSGEDADDRELVAEERAIIEDRYAPLIQEALSKRGYKTQLASEGAPTGISLTLTGHVTRFEHGDQTSRVMLGFGSGSSNMYTSFTLENLYDDSIVTQFEVVATSGGNSGIQSLGSYLEAHLEDGAAKVADYLAGRTRR